MEISMWYGELGGFSECYVWIIFEQIIRYCRKIALMELGYVVLHWALLQKIKAWIYITLMTNAVINYPDQKQFGMKVIRETQRRDSRQEHGGRNWSRMLTGFYLMACSYCFLIQPRTIPLLRVDTAPLCLILPNQSLIMEMPPQIFLQAIWWSLLLSCGSFF